MLMPEEIKKKSHSLSIFLLKSGLDSSDEALKDRASLDGVAVSMGDLDGDLYFRQNQSHPPAWVKLFRSSLEEQLAGLSNSGNAAVFIVPIEERFFALTFGYGKSLLVEDACEENFGLRVVLNAVDPDKLRSVDALSLDAVSLNTRSQSSVASSIAGFGIDVEQDLLCAATGRPKDPLLGKSITGKDSLKLAIPIVIGDIPELLRKLNALYASEEYKSSFSWIDNLKQVRSRALIEKLDAELGQKITQKEYGRSWLAIPETIDWADIEGFRYEVDKDGEIREDIGWETYVGCLAEGTVFSRDLLKRHHVAAVRQSSGQEAYSWSVYKCVCCEITVDGEDYALNNGKWYSVNAAFLHVLNEAIGKVPRASLSLPAYKGSENAYNRATYDANPSYYALMDRRLIYHGGGSSSIEFCDLYTTDKKLIHVKKYSGSSVLSHLFSQGTVSARLFLSDAEFREKVNNELPDSHKFGDAGENPIASQYEVVFVVATNHKGEGEPKLPLFSKITLKNSVQQLQAYGVRVGLMFLRADVAG